MDAFHNAGTGNVDQMAVVEHAVCANAESSAMTPGNASARDALRALSNAMMAAVHPVSSVMVNWIVGMTVMRLIAESVSMVHSDVRMPNASLATGSVTAKQIVSMVTMSVAAKLNALSRT